MNIEATEWKNYGDINYQTNGGCLVRRSFTDDRLKKYPSLSSCYDVFFCNTEAGDHGDKIFAALCQVDIKDSWIDKDDILVAIGLEDMSGRPLEEILEPEQWAKEMVGYYGVQNFGGRSFKSEYPDSFEEYLVTQEELHEWLCALGTENIVGKEVLVKAAK